MTDWSVIVNISESSQFHIAIAGRIGLNRHCERSEAIHLAAQRKNGLLRRKRSSQ
jgi:hypothetical protein